MEDNPYTPPAAEVADPRRVQRPRPRGVNIALALIVLGLAMQLVFQLWFLQRVNFQFADPFQAALAAGLFLLYGFLCHQMAQGRAWPRVVLLLLTLGGFISSCYAIGYMLKLD